MKTFKKRDAMKILNSLGLAGVIDIKQLTMGMNHELEHRDITGGDPLLTAKIAVAHLMEIPNYYTLLKYYKL